MRVQSNFIKKGHDILKTKNASTTFSVTSFPFPIFRGMKINTEGTLEMFWPEHRLTRSQDLPEAYHDAGQFYWFCVKEYLKNPDECVSKALPIVLPRFLVQDIDTFEDLHCAELVFKALKDRSVFDGVLSV